VRIERNELKFYLTPAEGFVLRRALQTLLVRDSHGPTDAGYFIRSLYFDDLDDSALTNKLDGLTERRKVRLRVYDLEQERVRLEVKRKRADFVQKAGAWLSRHDALRLAR
jgi:hypothetical protein